MSKPLARARAWGACALVSVLFAAAGCGGPYSGINRGGKLTGKVTIDGKPVSAGEVIVYGADGKHSASGRLRTDGTYVVIEPPLGDCKIAVVTSTFKDVPPPGAKKGPMDYTDPETGQWPIYVRTPERYEKPDTSNLTVKVSSGEQSHDIPLTTNP
jgi:hypothetical protein